MLSVYAGLWGLSPLRRRLTRRTQLPCDRNLEIDPWTLSVRSSPRIEIPCGGFAFRTTNDGGAARRRTKRHPIEPFGGGD